jgi:hypothetical protein
MDRAAPAIGRAPQSSSCAIQLGCEVLQHDHAIERRETGEMVANPSLP